MKSSWKSIFLEEENKPYFEKLNAFLKAEMENGKPIFPPEKNRCVHYLLMIKMHCVKIVF
jgi:uracil DNA glycosylase